MKKTLVLLSVIALLVVALPMVSAQDVTTNAVGTLTYTEEEINETYWVNNPANRHLSNVYVDLQAANGGQVEISAVYTWRPVGGGTQSADVAVVIAPRISNGRLFWDVVSITANGQPASADIVRQVNANLSASWRRYIADHLPVGRLTGVSISDDDITFTYTPRQ
ncbi:MAG: hypothetical protein U0521_17085 [Anaerolineae bacterium]